MNRSLLSSGTLLVAMACAGALTVPGLAWADDTQSSDSTALDTVLVTAQHRVENIQDVPLGVTAVSGDALREQHIEQLQELRFTDTSVQYRVSTGSNTSAFAIRGVGTASFSAGLEQSVSTVVDGIVLGDPSSVATLADVDQVEILRGPQGMLFGKNASAGVISINTTNPKLGLYQGQVHLSYGENNEQIGQGILNIPLGDKVAARVVVIHNELDGWVKAPLLGGIGINSIDMDGARAKLLWEPTDNIRSVLAADYATSNRFCCSQVVRSAPDPHSGVAVADRLNGIVESPDNYTVADGAAPTGFARIGGASLQTDITLAGGYGVTSIFGYRSSRRSLFYDADFAPFNFADINGGATDLFNKSAELRLTSPTGKRFDYVVGLFAYDSHTKGVIGQTGYIANPTIDTDVIPVANQILQTAAQYSDVKAKDYAAYGQAHFQVTDTLSAIGGLRYTHDALALHYTASGLDHSLPLRGFYPASGFAANSYIGYNGPYVTPCVTAAQAVLPARPNCFPAIDQTTSASNVSWRIGLENKFTPDIMAYATASRGYKGPGFSSLTITASAIVNNQADQTIKPEIPTSYEIGFKSQLYDRRVTFNIDVYQTNYKDFQAQVSTPTPNGFLSIVHNAGSVLTKGVETTLAFRITPDLTANLNGSYTHARYGDFPGVSCYLVLTNAQTGATVNQPNCTTVATATLAVGTINAAGNRLAGSPDEQYTAALNYERPKTFGDLTFYAAGNYYWQSAVNYSAAGDPLALQPAFGMLGGSIGIGAAKDKWRLSLYATNIWNKHWAANISPAPTQALNPGGSIQYFSPDSFRHVGVRLDAKF